MYENACMTNSYSVFRGGKKPHLKSNLNVFQFKPTCETDCIGHLFIKALPPIGPDSLLWFLIMCHFTTIRIISGLLSHSLSADHKDILCPCVVH